MTAQKRRQRPQSEKKNTLLPPVLLYVVVFAFCVIAGVANSIPEKREFAAGTLCVETITAPRDIVDEYATKLLQQEEMQKVPPVYKLDDAVSEDCEDNILTAFKSLEQVRIKAKQIYAAMTPDFNAASFDPAKADWYSLLSKPDMSSLKALVPEYITEEDIYTVAAMGQDRLGALRDAILERVRTQMGRGILTEDVQTVAESVRSGFLGEGLFTSGQADLADDVARNNLKANKIFDSDATELARTVAAENVKPVQYKKGQNIVQKGEIITEGQYALIKQLGLTSDNTSAVSRWIVGVILMGIAFGAAFYYAFIDDRTLLESMKMALSISLLTVLGVLLALVCKKLDVRLNPVFLPAILGAVILRRKTALAYSVFMSMVISFVMAPVSGFFFDGQVLRMLVASIFGSAAAILFLRKKQRRGEFVLAGVIAGAVNALIYLCFGVIDGYALNQNIIIAGFGLANGVVGGLLSVGMLPIWETVFSLSTPSKLLELANPGNELLKRLMIEAPGTYHHSIMTANLAEAGAEAVGADALLARVSSYFHDIGKINKPLMYKENQMNIDNPHDIMKPEESAEIIISHVANGVALAEKYKLPQKIRDIIEQHHGDSLAAYFYYKAKQNGDLEENGFRYAGPKPQTKEAGIVMLADIVEAAIRANAGNGKNNIAEQVEKLIKSKYDDGQLDDCPLNRRDLKHIAAAFIHVFEGANHERIAYPEEDE